MAGTGFGKVGSIGCARQPSKLPDKRRGRLLSATVRPGAAAWTFPGNQMISTLWNGSHSQSGAAVSVTNASWTATIPANGGSVTVGFGASYSGANALPTDFALNGMACAGSGPTDPGNSDQPQDGNRLFLPLLTQTR